LGIHCRIVFVADLIVYCVQRLRFFTRINKLMIDWLTFAETEQLVSDIQQWRTMLSALFREFTWASRDDPAGSLSLSMSPLSPTNPKSKVVDSYYLSRNFLAI